jgi:YidC/Oxa1 family membrane protein insertase
MEGGRFLLAVILMIAVVVITNLIFPPVPPQSTGGPDSLALPIDSGARPAVPPPALADSSVLAQPPPVLGEAQPAGLADTVLITGPLYRYGISTHGGALVVADLVQYESLTREGDPVGLVPEGSGGLIRYRLRMGERTIDLSSLAFRAEPGADITLAEGGTPDSLRLVHSDSARGFGVELTYRFTPDDYLFDVSARVTGAGSTTPQLLIDLGPTLPFHEWNEAEEVRTLAYVVNNPQRGIESVSLDRVQQERIENGPLVWVAIKNKYFLAAAIQSVSNPMPFGGLIAQPTAGEHRADLTATLLPNTEGDFVFRLYMGPQQADRLAAVGNQLQDVNPYGWRFLRPVIRPLAHAITWLLLEMHRVLGLGYGWVLILFGVLVRVLLWPLNARAMRSQMKSMELQPRLKELQTKYKAEPERLQKEMLRLYKEEGFNPMGGCLPLLIPFPVLITLFFVFQATIEFRGEPWLWLPDLSRPDPLYIIPVLMGVSMFALQWLSMRSARDVNPQMKFMMWFMPIFMVVIFLKFASGLNLYYTAMNIASIPQQLLISRERAQWHAARGTGV